MGCARQCLETKATLLAGCRYAVGARKGIRECEERMMVSLAFMRSIGWGGSAAGGGRVLLAKSEVGLLVLSLWLALAHFTLLAGLLAGLLWGALHSVGGDFAATSRNMTRAVAPAVKLPRRICNFQVRPRLHFTTQQTALRFLISRAWNTLPLDHLC